MNTLDRIAAHVQQAQEGAGMALLLAQRVGHATTEQARGELALQAAHEAKRGQDAASVALDALQEAGATLPPRGAARSISNPLADLARVERSRPQAVALLEALRSALPCAEDLDEARGDMLDVAVNGSRGTVWGESLVQMIAGLELELYGPSKRVTGCRE